MKTIINCMIASMLLGATVSQADLYEFRFAGIGEEGDTITNEFALGVGEEQFRMVVDITDPAAGYATFSFYNIGSTASVLSSVRLDEGSGIGLQLDTIINSYTPGYLAGDANTVDFKVMNNANIPPLQGIVFDADVGVVANMATDLYTAAVLNGSGYESAEVLTLEMSYNAGSDLLAMLTSGELRVATKIQGVEYPGSPGSSISEYFVNETAYTVIPEPASVVLLVGASTMIGFVRRRFMA